MTRALWRHTQDPDELLHFFRRPAILPDQRGFGASDKPRDPAAYAGSAMARDVLALIEHLGLDAVDVIGFSMGCGTAAGLLALRPPAVKRRWNSPRAGRSPTRCPGHSPCACGHADA